MLGLTFGALNSLAQEKRKKQLKKKRVSAERVSPKNVHSITFVDAHVHLNDVEMQMLFLTKPNNLFDHKVIKIFGFDNVETSNVEIFGAN